MYFNKYILSTNDSSNYLEIIDFKLSGPTAPVLFIFHVKYSSLIIGNVGGPIAPILRYVCHSVDHARTMSDTSL